MPFQRDLSMDALRALAMLYIVGFWHPLAASHLFGDLFYGPATILLSFCFLGLFCFISGFLITHQRPSGFTDAGEVSRFYLRRLGRIYPLYLTACIGFYAAGLIPESHFTAAIFLSGAIRNINILTLWFVNVIIIFYLMTPLLLFRFHVRRSFWLALGMYVAMFYMSKAKWIDSRLAHYFIIYAAGIFLGRSPNAQEWLRRNGWKLLPVFLLLGWLAMTNQIPHGKGTGFILRDVAVLASMPPFLALGRWLANTIPAQLISIVSYSSFALYLFHRLIYTAAHFYCHPQNVLPTVLLNIGVLLPISIGIAYGVQSAYDAVLKLPKIFPDNMGLRERILGSACALARRCRRLADANFQ